MHFPCKDTVDSSIKKWCLLKVFVDFFGLYRKDGLFAPENQEDSTICKLSIIFSGMQFLFMKSSFSKKLVLHFEGHKTI